MRLVTWNSHRGGQSSVRWLESLEPDVAVVPESAAPSPEADASIHVSLGPNPSKCLSVMAFGGTTLDAHDARLPWVLPVTVNSDDPFLLLAVWTVQRDGLPTYAGQVAAAIDAYEEELASGTAVLAGDFNCSGNTADPRPHLKNVARLEQLGMRSAYHDFVGCEPGCEPVGTLFWRWKAESAFHCDLVFVPEPWTSRISAVNVGSFQDWVAGRRSDHCPVIVDLEPVSRPPEH